jgi:hypothetical protein
MSDPAHILWQHAPIPAVCTLELASTPEGPWRPVRNRFAAATAGAMPLAPRQEDSFYRLRAVDISATPAGFTNLVHSYGLLETISGTGAGQEDGVSYWQSWNEGNPAQWAALSRPHYAQADQAGNVYIVDKNSHSILVVRPEGTIHTHAGTHAGGFNGEGPAPATSLQLNFPNGAWVRPDGTIYILDTENGRVRRVDTNGVMATLFVATPDASPISGGRGLWVNESETLAYFCSGTRLRRWTPSGGVRNVATGFAELGTLFVEDSGDILLCDRGAHQVYRITPGGSRTVIAGNGTSSGGGDGFHALQTGLRGVRSIWPMPHGGFLLLTHDGCQLWHMDASGIVRLFLNGERGRTHAGDGSFFYGPEPKISEGRSVTMDLEGNILVTESDWGYVRRIRFLPLSTAAEFPARP